MQCIKGKSQKCNVLKANFAHKENQNASNSPSTKLIVQLSLYKGGGGVPLNLIGKLKINKIKTAST